MTMKTRRLFAIVAALICTAVLCAAQTQAASNIIDSGYCGEDPNPGDNIGEYGENLSWILTDDGVLTISGSGYMSNPYDGMYCFPWDNQKNIIKTVVINEGVTNISNSAFGDCDVLSSVTISSSVTEIGSRAFYGCSGLTELTIPAGVKYIDTHAFYCDNLRTLNYNAANCINPYGTYSPLSNSFGWKAIETLNIGDSVKSIPDYAFSLCMMLTEVTIPESVTSIGAYAFTSCESLVSVHIPENVTSIGEFAFQACSSLDGVILPESVTSIGKYAFEGCKSLSEIVIPESVTEIGWVAFSGCSSLPSITVPEGVTFIGGEAFKGCSSLISVLIPEGVTILGSPMGGQYPLLESLIIRSDIDFDGQIFDFSASPLLRRIEAPASVFNDGRDDVGFTQLPIDSAIVSLGTIDYRGFEFLNLCRSTLRYINLSKAENTELPDEALAECYRADSIALPSNLERVGYAAFRGCMALKSIDIPASVTEIDDNAFEDCRSITAINFSGSEDAPAEAGRASAPAAQSALRRIGNWAFYNCHQLQHLVIPEGVTEIGDAAFYGCTYLEDLELPSTVTRIGDNCFALCSKLKQIRVRAAVPPEIEAKTFYDVNREIPVYVPKDCLDDYREDPYWREFNLIGEEHGGTVGTDHTAIGGLYRMEDGRIVLTEEMPVSVYTASGALVYSGTATEVALPAPGVYWLRIGGETVKVVRP